MIAVCLHKFVCLQQCHDSLQKMYYVLWKSKLNRKHCIIRLYLEKKSVKVFFFYSPEKTDSLHFIKWSFLYMNRH